MAICLFFFHFLFDVLLLAFLVAIWFRDEWNSIAHYCFLAFLVSCSISLVSAKKEEYISGMVGRSLSGGSGLASAERQTQFASSLLGVEGQDAHSKAFLTRERSILVLSREKHEGGKGPKESALDGEHSGGRQRRGTGRGLHWGCLMGYGGGWFKSWARRDVGFVYC